MNSYCVSQMQASLAQMRSAVTNATAVQNRNRQQLKKAIEEVTKWQSRKQLAQERGEIDLAQKASLNADVWHANVRRLEEQVKRDVETVEQLKARLADSQTKVSRVRERTTTPISTVVDQNDDEITNAIVHLERKFLRVSSLTQEACQDLAELKVKIRKAQPPSRAEFVMTDGELEQLKHLLDSL